VSKNINVPFAVEHNAIDVEIACQPRLVTLASACIFNSSIPAPLRFNTSASSPFFHQMVFQALRHK